MRNMKIQNSYNSYRHPSQDMPNFSIRHSLGLEDHGSSNDTLRLGVARDLPPNVRSMSGIKYEAAGSVNETIPNMRGMFALPSLRNQDALQLLSNYQKTDKFGFM